MRQSTLSSVVYLLIVLLKFNVALCQVSAANYDELTSLQENHLHPDQPKSIQKRSINTGKLQEFQQQHDSPDQSFENPNHENEQEKFENPNHENGSETEEKEVQNIFKDFKVEEMEDLLKQLKNKMAKTKPRNIDVEDDNRNSEKETKIEQNAFQFIKDGKTGRPEVLSSILNLGGKLKEKIEGISENLLKGPLDKPKKFFNEVQVEYRSNLDSDLRGRLLDLLKTRQNSANLTRTVEEIMALLEEPQSMNELCHPLKNWTPLKALTIQKFRQLQKQLEEIIPKGQFQKMLQEEFSPMNTTEVPDSDPNSSGAEETTEDEEQKAKVKNGGNRQDRLLLDDFQEEEDRKKVVNEAGRPQDRNLDYDGPEKPGSKRLDRLLDFDSPYLKNKTEAVKHFFVKNLSTLKTTAVDDLSKIKDGIREKILSRMDKLDLDKGTFELVGKDLKIPLLVKKKYDGSMTLGLDYDKLCGHKCKTLLHNHKSGSTVDQSGKPDEIKPFRKPLPPIFNPGWNGPKKINQQVPDEINPRYGPEGLKVPKLPLGNLHLNREQRPGSFKNDQRNPDESEELSEELKRPHSPKFFPKPSNQKIYTEDHGKRQYDQQNPNYSKSEEADDHRGLGQPQSRKFFPEDRENKEYKQENPDYSKSQEYSDHKGMRQAQISKYIPPRPSEEDRGNRQYHQRNPDGLKLEESYDHPGLGRPKNSKYIPPRPSEEDRENRQYHQRNTVDSKSEESYDRQGLGRPQNSKNTFPKPSGGRVSSESQGNRQYYQRNTDESAEDNYEPERGSYKPKKPTNFPSKLSEERVEYMKHQQNPDDLEKEEISTRFGNVPQDPNYSPYKQTNEKYPDEFPSRKHQQNPYDSEESEEYYGPTETKRKAPISKLPNAKSEESDYYRGLEPENPKFFPKPRNEQFYSEKHGNRQYNQQNSADSKSDGLRQPLNPRYTFPKPSAGRTNSEGYGNRQHYQRNTDESAEDDYEREGGSYKPKKTVNFPSNPLEENRPQNPRYVFPKPTEGHANRQYHQQNPDSSKSEEYDDHDGLRHSQKPKYTSPKTPESHGNRQYHRRNPEDSKSEHSEEIIDRAQTYFLPQKGQHRFDVKEKYDPDYIESDEFNPPLIYDGRTAEEKVKKKAQNFAKNNKMPIGKKLADERKGIKTAFKNQPDDSEDNLFQIPTITDLKKGINHLESHLDNHKKKVFKKTDESSFHMKKTSSPIDDFDESAENPLLYDDRDHFDTHPRNLDYTRTPDDSDESVSRPLLDNSKEHRPYYYPRPKPKRRNEEDHFD